jgi:hypothetical protein
LQPNNKMPAGNSKVFVGHVVPTMNTLLHVTCMKEIKQSNCMGNAMN